jgi:hypothetical protein
MEEGVFNFLRDDDFALEFVDSGAVEISDHGPFRPK